MTNEARTGQSPERTSNTFSPQECVQEVTGLMSRYKHALISTPEVVEEMKNVFFSPYPQHLDVARSGFTWNIQYVVSSESERLRLTKVAPVRQEEILLRLVKGKTNYAEIDYRDYDGDSARNSEVAVGKATDLLAAFLGSERA